MTRTRSGAIVLSSPNLKFTNPPKIFHARLHSRQLIVKSVKETLLDFLNEYEKNIVHTDDDKKQLLQLTIQLYRKGDASLTFAEDSQGDNVNFTIYLDDAREIQYQIETRLINLAEFNEPKANLLLPKMKQ